MALHKDSVHVIAGCYSLSSPGSKRLSGMKGVTVVEIDVTSDVSVAKAINTVNSLCQHTGKLTSILSYSTHYINIQAS